MSEIKLKRKKEGGSGLSRLFASKKKRYFFMILFMLPFLIAIGIFGSIAYKEVKALLSTATGTVETKDENLIASQNFILRDNATDYQKELFLQLKSAIEEEEYDDVKIAQLVAQNFIADFYTWTNKQGQYDVGGMYYIYDGEYRNGDHYKENVYLAARDGFYKYLGNYMTDYGIENLLEVTNVEVVNCQKISDYVINEHVANKQDENGDWYDYREDHYFDAYNIQCRWTYDSETPLTLSNFANSAYMIVINDEGEFRITESSASPIEVNKRQDEDESESETEISESEESETESESESEQG